MTSGRTCPGRRGDTTCGQPLPDNAIRCPGCIRRMEVALRGGAALWPELDATIRRQTRLAAAATKPGRRPKPYLGPLCPADDSCRHDSCWHILWTGIGAARVAHEEPPIPNEDSGVLNLAALDIQWAALNTFTAWAQVIATDYGVPIPHDPRRPTKPAPPLARRVTGPICDPATACEHPTCWQIIAAASLGPGVQRCPMTDLMTAPIAMCGCPRHPTGRTPR